MKKDFFGDSAIKYPAYEPWISKDDKKIVNKVLGQNMLTLGPQLERFERDFSKYTKSKYAVAVSNCTAALHLSLKALGIGKKDEVVIPDLTFVADANAILACNARPVIADINKNNFFLSISNLKKNITKKTKAIIPVHIYGQVCNIEEVLDVARDYNLKIIEDCAHAIGTFHNSRHVGTIGHTGCFSFYPTKNMTVGGDGGMVTTNNEDVAKTIISLRDNGRQTQSEHDKLGYTMRLNTINAAIGRVQLKQLDHMNSKRREIAQIYKKNIGEENFLIENSNGVSVYHQIVLKHENRDKIIEYLKKNEIGYAVHYSIPIHKQPLYLSYGFNLQKSEKFSSQILSLPSYPSLPHENIKIICEKINDII